MNEEPRNIPAFKDRMQDTGFGDTHVLYRFENDPRFVIRGVDFTELNDQVYRKDAISIQDAARESKELFAELENYGITAPINIVIANDDRGQESMFVVTDRIEAADQGKFSSDESARYIEATTHLFDCIVSYYENKLQAGSNALDDIGPLGQYVYGKRSGSAENKFYLVDTDPWFTNDRVFLKERIQKDLIQSIQKFQKMHRVDLAPLIERCKHLIENT